MNSFAMSRCNSKPNYLQGIENAYQPSQSGSHHQQQQQPQTHQSYGNISNQQIHYHNSQHSPPNNALHGSHGNLTNLGNVSIYRLIGLNGGQWTIFLERFLSTENNNLFSSLRYRSRIQVIEVRSVDLVLDLVLVWLAPCQIVVIRIRVRLVVRHLKEIMGELKFKFFFKYSILLTSSIHCRQYDSYYLNPSIQATFEQFSLVSVVFLFFKLG